MKPDLKPSCVHKERSASDISRKVKRILLGVEILDVESGALYSKIVLSRDQCRLASLPYELEYTCIKEDFTAYG